jgi:hypothetical protein
MALFFLLGVLRGFPAVAYRRTPHRKPLCGLDQNKNCSFLNWTQRKSKNGETSGVKNFQQTGMKLRFFLFLLKDTWPGQLFL